MLHWRTDRSLQNRHDQNLRLIVVSWENGQKPQGFKNILHGYVCHGKNWWNYLLLIRRGMPHCLLQSPRQPRSDWPGPISPLNYLITRSRWDLWIILSPNHAHIFQLPSHQSGLNLPVSYHHPIIASTSRVTWEIFSIQSMHQSSAYPQFKDKCMRQVSMRLATFPPFHLCRHCCTVYI